MLKDNPILKNIADNPELLKAVKEIILYEFEVDSGFTNGKTNEEIGEIVRARIGGGLLVEQAFKKIESYKVINKPEIKENPAY